MSEGGSGNWNSYEGYSQMGQSGANAGSIVATLINMGRESSQSKMARHRWESMRAPAATLLSQLYYSPGSRNVVQGGGSKYKWAPTQATQNIYENYLNRQYGLSRGTAQSISAQALKPVAIGNLRGGSSSAATYSGSRVNAQAIAQAAMGTQQGNILRSQDYLANAGKLAAYNLWRAQQLGQIIG